MGLDLILSFPNDQGSLALSPDVSRAIETFHVLVYVQIDSLLGC